MGGLTAAFCRSLHGFEEFHEGYGKFFFQPWVRSDDGVRRPCGTKLAEYVGGLRGTCSTLLVPALVYTVASAGMARPAAAILGCTKGRHRARRTGNVFVLLCPATTSAAGGVV